MPPDRAGSRIVAAAFCHVDSELIVLGLKTNAALWCQLRIERAESPARLMLGALLSLASAALVMPHEERV